MPNIRTGLICCSGNNENWYWMRSVITICLDRHYQRFLRAKFKCRKETFEFPQRHKFNTILEHFVTEAPDNYEDVDYGERSFKILLPEMVYGSAKRWQLKPTRETIFKQSN